MAKRKSRRDNKGRALRTGEYQRACDGVYLYKYKDLFEKWHAIYAGDLVELRVKEKQLLKDQLDGLDIYVAGKATLNMCFDRYIATKRNLRPSTKSNYLYMYDHFVRDGFGKKLIAEIKFSEVKLFYTSLLDNKNMQINTLETIHTILHPTFQMAVRDDIIRKNPTDGVMTELKRGQGKNKGIRHALTAEQQKAFLHTVAELPEYQHWLPLFTVLLGTGCRIGEIIGLRWEDVDLEERTININHSVSYYARENRKSYFEVSLPKTEAGIRIIPMLDDVHDVLGKEYERQMKEGFSTLELNGMTDFIFTNKNGNFHNPSCLNRTIARISETYNAKEEIAAKRENRDPVLIPHFSCHHLRHTFCSRLCENEPNVKVIQDIMGHANIETTMDIYAEVNYARKQKSISNLDQKLDLFS